MNAAVKVQLLMLPDAKPDCKEAMKRAQSLLEECNYALHKCQHAWKLQEQLQHPTEHKGGNTSEWVTIY